MLSKADTLIRLAVYDTAAADYYDYAAAAATAAFADYDADAITLMPPPSYADGCC